MNTTKYPHLRQWTPGIGMTAWDSGSNYAGPDLSKFYVTPFMRNRDSDALVRSNFEVAWESLEPLGAELVRFGHWACGWVEQIHIPVGAEVALVEAEQLATKLEDYPILDEMAYGELQWTEAAEYWKRCSVRERARIIQENGTDASIYAARRPEVPDDSGVFEYLGGQS